MHTLTYGLRIEGIVEIARIGTMKIPDRQKTVRMMIPSRATLL